jgi:PAS domain S-box-containing protein
MVQPDEDNASVRRLLGPLLTAVAIAVLEMTDLDRYCPPGVLLTLTVLVSGFFSGSGAGLASALLAIVYQYIYYSGPSNSWMLPLASIPVFAAGGLSALVAAVFTGPQQTQRRRIDELARDVATLQGQLQERRLTEGALRQSEERFQRFIHGVPLPVVVVERNRVGFVNPAALTLFGATGREQLCGRSPFDLLQGEHQQIAREPIGQLLAGKVDHPISFERNMVRLSGEFVPVEIHAAPLDQTEGTAQVLVLRETGAEHKERENLRRELARMKDIIERQPDAVVMMGNDGRIVDVNRAGVLLFEADAAATLLGRSLVDLIVPEYRSAFVDLHRRVLQGVSGMIEMEMTALEDTRYWLECTVGPVRDENGRIVATIIGTRDITRRKKTERSLKTSEQRFRALVEMSSDMTLIMDGQGVILFASPSVVGILGYETQFLLGKSTFDIVHHDDRITAHSALRDTVANPGAVRRVELRIRHRDGSWRMLEAVGRAHMDSAAIHGVVINCRDITDRKAAEDALRDSRERLNGILNSLDDVVWSSTVRDCQPLYVGPAAEGVYGRAVSEFFARPSLWFDVVHPEDKRLVQTTTAQIVKTGHYDYEYRIIRPDGSIRWLRDRARLVTDSFRNPVRLDGIASDITDLKKAGSALIESRERLRTFARQLDSAIEEERTHIARELHDELGQALTGMKMDLAWMRRRLDDKSALKDVSILHGKINATGELIDATIAVVRRIAQRLRPTLLDNLGLVAAIEEYAGQFTDRTGVKCELMLPQDLVLDKSHASGVFRIFQEAMTNIARHSGADSAIVNIRYNQTNLMLEVADNGRGIDTGTGAITQTLGVLGMRERAQLMGGSLTVQPRKQGGTLVRLIVPLNNNENLKQDEEACA